MNVVYQLTYLDEDMGYYHIASSFDKSKLEAMIERVKEADAENQRILNNVSDDDIDESLDDFYEKIAGEKTFPLNQIDDYDWCGYEYENQTFAQYLEIREYDLI